MYFERLRKRLNGDKRLRIGLIAGLLALGVVLRFWSMRRGFNFDMESWRVSADITAHHGNVYAQTYRYNYGLVWFEFLHLFDRLAQLFPNPYSAFRWLIVGFLTLVDIGIWALLRKHFGTLAAFLFFLNPIAIIITGYHNQFDNLAILLALAAMTVYGNATGGLTRRKWAGLALLGVSLVTKHVFFLLPLWLALKQKGWKEKLLTLAVPLAIFLLAFVPFVFDHAARQGLVHNVFGYASFNNAPFWYTLVPQAVQALVGFKVLFFAALVVFGFVMRKRPVVESLLIYTIVLVVFSAAIANQYLAIVCAAIAVYPNIFFALYTFFATLLLALSPAGLHSNGVFRRLPHGLADALMATYRAYDIPIVMLALGLIWHFYKEQIITFSKLLVRWVRQEFQFK